MGQMPLCPYAFGYMCVCVCVCVCVHGVCACVCVCVCVCGGGRFFFITLYSLRDTHIHTPPRTQTHTHLIHTPRTLHAGIGGPRRLTVIASGSVSSMVQGLLNSINRTGAGQLVERRARARERQRERERERERETERELI